MLLAAPVSADVKAAPTTQYSPPTFIMQRHIQLVCHFLLYSNAGFDSCSTDQEVNPCVEGVAWVKSGMLHIQTTKSMM
jgi:hypothetical protein